MSELSEDRDIRVSAERTGLAWGRSGLGVLACLAILAQRFFPLDTRADHVAAYLLLGLGGVGWAVSAYLGRTRVIGTGTAGAASGRRLRFIAASTVVIAVAGFVLGLFPPPT
jgi:uncharacterized membrane protein YidH (DUF202 family)